MLSWLLVAALGMMWAAFFLPSVRRSPVASVQEFERRMRLLAEAHRRGTGRWVLVPQKGRRFVGPRARERLRVRRRRRLLFVLLAEALGLTLLMGLFPPLRGMLVASGLLALLLLAYAVFLLRVRAKEVARARRRARARRAQRWGAFVPTSAVGGRGAANGRAVNGRAAGGHRGVPAALDEGVHVVVRRVGGARGG